MTNNNWKEHFQHHRHLQLALELRGDRPLRPVRCLGDEQVLLLGGASSGARESRRKPKEHEILSIVVTPDGRSDVQELLAEARADYPRAEASGSGSESLDVQAVYLGLAAEKFSGEEIEIIAGLPLLATFKYSPEVQPEALLAVCEIAADIAELQGIVPLPLGAGDRIPLPGATTSGPLDMMVISVLRHFLPAPIRVRASWAALGWKVAQMGLLYGADELAGWSAAESVAYSSRVRSAGRVETPEVEQGVEEAGREWAPWLAKEGAVR
ncbi:MAG: hypothetical protein WC314_12450 [Vulcanimicrobiota bacterium]